MKKVLATMLALVLALGMCAVAFAADEVAEVEGVAYASLQEAVNAANGQTVKLLDNVTVVGSVTTIPAGTKVALDLNGKTLTGTNTPTKEQALLVNGELVIVDSSEAKTGTIKSDYTGTSGQIILVASGGKLTMAGGKITTEGMTKAGNAVKVAPGAVLEMTGGVIECDAKRGNKAVNIAYNNDKVNKVESWGTFIMTGGAVIADGGDGSETSITAVEGNFKCAINIGGSSVISGPQAVIANTSNVSIDNGTFTGTMKVKKGAITGGTYTTDVSEYVTTESIPVAKRADNSYVVGVSAVVAAANEDGAITIVKGNDAELTGVNSGVNVKVVGGGSVTVNGTRVTNDDIDGYTVPSAPKYYYTKPSTDTTTSDTTKGSPKTFDAGVGVYAVTAVLSLTGMAWTAKKRH